ncbi:hypothetical protein LJR153_007284 [Paenibacillus sp. LjRoot153]|uniref:hypothetical protein n=1 Tax=Paenibacillus sp. LjRoot153 TaxID=3342270 RepID=UPI003ECD1458
MNYLFDLIKTIFPDPQSALLIIVLTVVGISMYRQLRTTVLESQKNLIIKTEKAIEVYSELEIEMKRIIRERLEISPLEMKISKAKVFIPYELLKEFDEWFDSDDVEEKYESLKALRKKLKEEILRLKRTQYDPITYQNNGGITEYIGVYFKTKLSSLVEPLVHTGIILFVSLTVFLIFSVLNTTHYWKEKVLIISVLVAFVLFIMILDIIVSEIMMKKRFKNSTVNWSIFGLFLITTFLLIFIGPWFRGILLVLLIFVYAFFASRYSIENSS